MNSLKVQMKQKTGLSLIKLLGLFQFNIKKTEVAINLFLWFINQNPMYTSYFYKYFFFLQVFFWLIAELQESQ